MSQTRSCSKCGATKPLDDKHFRPTKDSPGNFRRSCRRCEAGGSKKRRGTFRGNALTGSTPDFAIDIDPSDWVPSNTPATPEATPAYRPPTVPINTVSPPADPLAEAYQNKAERDERRTTKRERDALLEENAKLKATIGELVKMQKAPDVLVYKRAESSRSDAIACAIASDWHCEEPVEAASVHGLNEYSLDIAKARSEAFFRNLLRLTDIMARESKITTIYIAALGDFFSGFIHDELMAANALAPGDAARFWRGLFAAGIDFLVRESSYEIEADLIPGNHGRMTKRIWFSDPTGTSLETFAYHALAGRYEGNPRVHLRPAANAMVYRQFFERFVVRMIHGYEVNYGGGVGGLTIPLRKAIARWDKAVRANLTLLGHFHQRLDGGDFMVNGSMIGFNQYAQAHGFSPEPPEQSFFLVDARNGGEKSVVAPIWLDEAKRDRADAA